MLILGIFGGICLILGVVFLLGKKNLQKMEDVLNKPVISSGNATKYNKVLGTVLLILAAVLFYLSWAMKR